jgi:hypothetical protein
MILDPNLGDPFHLNRNPWTMQYFFMLFTLPQSKWHETLPHNESQHSHQCQYSIYTPYFGVIGNHGARLEKYKQCTWHIPSTKLTCVLSWTPAKENFIGKKWHFTTKSIGICESISTNYNKRSLEGHTQCMLSLVSYC